MPSFLGFLTRDPSLIWNTAILSSSENKLPRKWAQQKCLLNKYKPSAYYWNFTVLVYLQWQVVKKSSLNLCRWRGKTYLLPQLLQQRPLLFLPWLWQRLEEWMSHLLHFAWAKKKTEPLSEFLFDDDKQSAICNLGGLGGGDSTKFNTGRSPCLPKP